MPITRSIEDVHHKIHLSIYTFTYFFQSAGGTLPLLFALIPSVRFSASVFRQFSSILMAYPSRYDDVRLFFHIIRIIRNGKSTTWRPVDNWHHICHSLPICWDENLQKEAIFIQRPSPTEGILGTYRTIFRAIENLKLIQRLSAYSPKLLKTPNGSEFQGEFFHRNQNRSHSFSYRFNSG